MIADLHINLFSSGNHRPNLQKIEDRFISVPLQMDGEFNFNIAAHPLFSNFQYFFEYVRQRICRVFQQLSEGHNLHSRDVCISHTVFICNIR